MVVVAGWAVRDTDPVPRDPGLDWAVAEDQAAGEPAGAAALGCRGAGGLVVPAYGNLVVRRVAEVAREQVPVAKVAEVERVAGLDQEPAAEVVA